MSNDGLKLTILELLNQIQAIINNYKKNELSVISRFYDYNEFNNMFGNKISKENYSGLREKIDLINFKELEDKFNEIEHIVNDYQEKCKNNWSEYNNNFKNHLKNKFSNLLSSINAYNIYNFGTDSPELLINKYIDFSNNILNINTNKEIMESFSYGAKNYVIFGKNGAGKTRLLKYIKENYFNSNSFVVPSDREIRFGKLNYISMDYPTRYPLTKIFGDTSNIYTNDVLTLLFKDEMTKELQKDETTTSDSEGNRNAISYDKFVKIYNCLGLDRKVFLDTSTNKIMLYNEELRIEPYYIQSGSDGEKSIVQFILFILLCPENSFVFIDEPESHFNTALLNELFNILEKERDDIVFIYCTHNVDFIELRANAKLIYLEKFDGKEWSINEFNSFDEISIENIINIVGTKKDILFIESEKGKLDYKLYCSIFEDFKVIPVSSCDRVIDYCKMLNGENYLNLNRNAYGIIDNDFRTKSEIDKLEKKKIFTLKYNEIENMLLSPCILEYICKKYGLENNLEKFKNAVIDQAIRDKNGIVKDFINKAYPKYQKSTKLDFDNNIKEFSSKIDLMNEENKNNFIKLFENFIEELDKTLESRDYDIIIRKYPNKGFVSCLGNFGITKDLYVSWVMDSLKKDVEFKQKVIHEMFDDFFE